MVEKSGIYSLNIRRGNIIIPCLYLEDLQLLLTKNIICLRFLCKHVIGIDTPFPANAIAWILSVAFAYVK